VTDLAIIIVSYNTKADLDRCLRSLHSRPPTASHDVVVVDNGSNDGSVELVKTGWPSVRLIETGANLGFSRATNLGIRSTASRLILLLNSDTVVPEGAIDSLIAELDANPGSAVAGPCLVAATGRPELSFGRMISPFNEFRQKLLGRLYDAGVPFAVAWVRRWTSRAHHPDWISGACLLVRRAEAERVGLLDERFFLYAEDVDFCASIRAGGSTVLFTPAVEVVHLRGRSVRHAAAAAELLYRRSQVAFYAKHHPRWTPWLRAYLRLRRRLPSAAVPDNSNAPAPPARV